MFDRRERQRVELARRYSDIRREYWMRKAWKYDYSDDFGACDTGKASARPENRAFEN
jgi:hypothetical protein